jgi:hypothetical protein
MDFRQRERLAQVLAVWVEKHAYPQVPTLAFSGRTYTPEEILEEVRAATELGESLGNFLYGAGEHHGVRVEDLIRRAIDANNPTQE